MATLKGVNMQKLDEAFDKINQNFKELKNLLKEELLNNNGSLSYDRLVEYENLFISLKRCKLIGDSLEEKVNSIPLEGDELDTFCSKIGITKDCFFKHQVIIGKISKFDLTKFVEGIREQINYNENSLLDEKEKNKKIASLERLAYVDKLTGLFNRTKYEEVLKEEKTNPNFGVIFFDLNYLKRTNDTYGHESGDNLIKSFAEVLQKSKTGKEDIYRIGGDEFVALFKDAGDGKFIKIYENALKYNVDQYNLSNDIEMSTSYGIALSKENLDLDIESLVGLADERMYEMKKKMKAERKD